VYDTYSANVEYVEKPYAHMWALDVPTDIYETGDCSSQEQSLTYPYMVNFGWDFAGDALNHLLPNVEGSTVTEVAERDFDW
jgi:hypothetical protein